MDIETVTEPVPQLLIGENIPDLLVSERSEDLRKQYTDNIVKYPNKHGRFRRAFDVATKCQGIRAKR